MILVREQKSDKPTRPTENVSDTYTLRVEHERDDPAFESEPNDIPSDANPIVIDVQKKGYLDHHDDVDGFTFRGVSGRYRVEVAGGPEQGLSWQHKQGAWQRDRSKMIQLNDGDMIALRVQSSAKKEGENVINEAPPYTITISSKNK